MLGLFINPLTYEYKKKTFFVHNEIILLFILIIEINILLLLLYSFKSLYKIITT